MFDENLDAPDLFGGLLRGALRFGEAWARVVLGSVMSGSSSSRGGGFGSGGFKTGGGF